MLLFRHFESNDLLYAGFFLIIPVIEETYSPGAGVAGELWQGRWQGPLYGWMCLERRERAWLVSLYWCPWVLVWLAPEGGEGTMKVPGVGIADWHNTISTDWDWSKVSDVRLPKT